MNLKRLPLLLLLSLLLAGCQSIRQVPPAEEPEVDPMEALQKDHLSAHRLESELGRVKRWGNGEVLVGRVVAPTATRVASRTNIHPDGSFATALFPGRQLIFYAHGYEPLVVARRNEISPSIHDVGVHEFTKSEVSQTRTASGSVVTSEPREIKVDLILPNNAYLGNDAGYWGGPVSHSVERKRLQSGEHFRFEGLSKIPYTLVISAPDFVTRRFQIEPTADDRALGDIILEKARVIRFDYVSQIDLASLNGDGERFSQTVICNGTNRFTYAESQDAHRNALFLRLAPTPGGVEASYTWHPSDFFDLGPGSLEDFMDDARLQLLLSKLQPARRMVLQDGHVYFFRNEYRNTSCLFQVSTPPAN